MVVGLMTIFFLYSFMDMNWQYNNPANPADAAMGPQVYDNHLYYSYVSQKKKSLYCCFIFFPSDMECVLFAIFFFCELDE